MLMFKYWPFVPRVDDYVAQFLDNRQYLDGPSDCLETYLSHGNQKDAKNKYLQQNSDRMHSFYKKRK